jgi:tRNA nucleotidyltransferase (CCA-adding enzyme)
LERLGELGVLAQLQPELAWTARDAAAFTRLLNLLEEPAWRDTLDGDSVAPIYFITWLASYPAEVAQAVAERIRARQSTREDIHTVRTLLQQLAALPADAQPGTIEKVLRPHNRRPRVYLAAAALSEDNLHIDHLHNYLFHYRHIKTATTGHTLRQRGLKPGPQYAQILDGLLAARLNGEVKTINDEAIWLEKWLAQHPS